MLRRAAMLLGLVLVLMGLLGFVPGFTSDGKLFGVFTAETMHNVVYLVTGVLALMAMRDEKWLTTYFKVLGVVYGVVALVGLVQQDTVLGVASVNMASNLLHLVLGVLGLGLGFGVKASK